MRWLVCLLGAGCTFARHDPDICGTHTLRAQEELFLHERAMRHGLTSHTSTRTVADLSQIAVIEDSDGVIAQRNPFDLLNKTVTFIPGDASASNYTFQTTGTSYDTSAAETGTLVSLLDDDTRLQTLPFTFPYFGVNYREIYVNSDGNLTFTAGDAASTDRSLGRFDQGQPRIAVLYADLNPPLSKQGVMVTRSADAFVVTWSGVPPYTPQGTGTQQTFQVRLHPTGRIEMTWPTVTLTDSVIGISPGKLSGTASLVSFSGGSSHSFSSAVAERFAGSDAVDLVTAAQRFYQNHEDTYDYLVIFNSEGIPASQDVQSYEFTTRSSGSGYGVGSIIDRGSAARLQAVLNMGPLSQYPSDPNAVLPFRAASGDTTLTLLGHQAGHLFLAYVSVPDPSNPQAHPMLGRSGSHWSFLYDSEASLLEGNRIVDHGAAASPRFGTTAAVQAFSPLDQYLMGLRLPAEVPDTFWVSNPSAGIGPTQAPQTGVSFNGDRQDVKIEDVIAAAGRRTPDATVAQRDFRFAFILIVPAGQAPDPVQLARLDTYRSQFQSAFGAYTSGRASADTTLKKALHLSLYPASGVVVGSGISATIALEHPAAGPLTVALTANSNVVTLPASVSISGGSMSAAFTISGINAGVAQITATPSDATYETAVVKLQAGSPGSLQLVILSGDQQSAIPGTMLASPVTVQLVDINALPYSGVHLKAVASSGTVQTEAVTDVNGVARFSWMLGSEASSTLTISMPNGGPTVKVTAFAKPDFTAAGVVNAASYAGGLCPGAIASIFGAGLSSAIVAVNGEPATVFYTSAGQVNFLVPADIAIGTAKIQVTNSLGASTSGSVPVIALQPGLFAAVDYGTYAELYGTGLGPLHGMTVVQTPQVSVAGAGVSVLYSGLAPGFLGLDQVNVALPAGTAPKASVVLTIGGISSNTVKLQ